MPLSYGQVVARWSGGSWWAARQGLGATVVMGVGLSASSAAVHVMVVMAATSAESKHTNG